MAIEFLRTQRHRRHPMRKLQTIITFDDEPHTVRDAARRATKAFGAQHSENLIPADGFLVLIVGPGSGIPIPMVASDGTWGGIPAFLVETPFIGADAKPSKCASRAAEWVIVNNVQRLEIFGNEIVGPGVAAWAFTYVTDMLAHLDRAGGLQHTH